MNMPYWHGRYRQVKYLRLRIRLAVMQVRETGLGSWVAGKDADAWHKREKTLAYSSGH